MLHFLTSLFQPLRHWLAKQPLAQRFYRRYPGLSRFILRRFDATTFIGLPLSLLVLAIGINAVLLSQLAEDVLESEGVVHMDEAFTQFLYNMRSEWLSQTFYGLTQLGTRVATFAVGGLATIVLLYKRRYAAVVAFWLTMAGVGLSVQYGKKIVSRDRPTEVAFYPEDNFSFPSGHATTSMGLWGILAYFAYRYLRQKWLRNTVLVSAAALILLIGFSRIYLGVHFLSDVLAGFLLGIMWVLLGVSIVEVMAYLQSRKKLQTAS